MKEPREVDGRKIPGPGMGYIRKIAVRVMRGLISKDNSLSLDAQVFE